MAIVIRRRNGEDTRIGKEPRGPSAEIKGVTPPKFPPRWDGERSDCKRFSGYGGEWVNREWWLVVGRNICADRISAGMLYGKGAVDRAKGGGSKVKAGNWKGRRRVAPAYVEQPTFEVPTYKR